MIMLFGESEMRQHEPYYIISNTFKIPLINWDFFPTSSDMPSFNKLK